MRNKWGSLVRELENAGAGVRRDRALRASEHDTDGAGARRPTERRADTESRRRRGVRPPDRSAD